ncbi:DUF2439 family protein [Quillaja saponaria]|uniref:DUF2439 family protein n=1 Tax=Quillaja saponaria TaxID=32244 RepID=A0AAD7L5Z5_QUISA|nr:DUF2439 family protein [Quillaja saponaria]
MSELIEFKKRELHKYGSPKSSPETTKHSSSEWQVLYTTHLTQKAKKYHDGFLQLAIQGSFGRQVILFDASRKFLDSRFLKKDEVVRTDESIAFDAYLVEIGEHEEDQKPNVNGQGNNCSTVARRGLKHEQKNYANTNVAVGNEWQVLYTTQLTQKAKKYHDGFLQLEVCGSRGRQVVLYDFSRKPLEHRLLKKDEVIIPGESISFNAHLVDIGEPEGNHQSPLNLNENGTVGKTGIRHGQYDCLWNNVSFAKGKPQNKAYSGKVADMNVLSDFDETKPTNTALPNMLLRNAKQILSMLQKPVAQGINFTGGQTLRSMRHHGSAENLEDGEPIEIMDIKKSPDVLSSKAICSSGMQLPENTEIGRSHQQNTDMEAERTSIGACSSTDPINDGGKGAEELTYSMNMDECPSFDLGF